MRRLGSSEIAAVCALYMPGLATDLPKSKTAGDVYFRLRHGLEQPSNARMVRGLREEQMLLDYYAEHIGDWWRARPLGEWWTVADRSRPDFTASPDAWDSPDHHIVIEGKTWDERWGRGHWGTPGTDEIATRYHYQAQWLLARCEAEECHVLVMFGRDVKAEDGSEEFVLTEPAIYPVMRNDALIATLDEMGERFLEEFVRTGQPPPVKPHSNRRKAKELVDAQHGEGAADEWYERCEERERAVAAADASTEAAESGAQDG